MLEKILEAIVGLTTALNAHTAALAANPPKAAAPGAKKAATAATEGQPAGATVTNTATAATPANTSQPAPAAATASSGPAAVDGKTACDALVAVASGVSRDAAIAILAKFGAQKFDGVKPDAYGAFYAECQAALASKTVAQSGAAGLF